MALKKGLGESYTPMYFLASLGSGGMAVSFFIYLMFMVDHPNTPLATFDFIYPVLTGGNIAISALVLLVLALILVFAYLHFRLLVWNIKEYSAFRRTEDYNKLRESDSGVVLMAEPLTYAMTVNVSFVLGAVFVPRLWTIVEFMFPGAIAAFLIIGGYALRIFVGYFGRTIMKGNYSFEKNNSLSQMLGVFAFSMVAVGLAAPAAMSHIKLTSAIGMFFSVFFLVLAISLAIVKMTLGMYSIFRYGISKEASPSLWIAIPIITLMGITMVRLTMALHHNYDVPLNPVFLYVASSSLISLQIVFGIVGYSVMKRIGYFRDYVYGSEKSPGAFALVCPGVAIVVFGMFFIYYGLYQNGIVDRFSIPYFLIIAPLTFIQIKTAMIVFRLNRKLISDQGGLNKAGKLGYTQ
ncbi:TsoY family (seleno)protein [Limisalsivibrio acetivorans]|uniref:TsoY family (seleno)protein n=1 Tax=Limisalsivibrio acetivorans TaxID=1304888 RepID=UPI0003B78B0F|nr:hypothetical protein [Limisalsivibrio acetivorans]